MTEPVYLPALTRPDPAAPEPLPVQIHRDLLAAIRAGRLADGARLPSSRMAAAALGLSRASVNTAYDLLRAEGVLAVRPGAAPEICAPKSAPAQPSRLGAGPGLSQRGADLAESPRRHLYAAASGRMSPGEPDEALFPADDWALALRRVARARHGGAFGYEQAQGHPLLRAEIAARLASDRGIRVSPGQILITPGTQASLALLAQVMGDPGEAVAMEDPGYVGARAAFLAAGLRPLPVPVDAQGLRVAEIPEGVRLVYVTPSNQYPLGVRMSLARRLALLELVRARGALLIEDDYDSEFLWRGREIAALAAHAAGGEVAYLGSAAKVLMPGLRLGWLVAPEPLVAALVAAQRSLGLLANLHAQLALADMMRSGAYRAHLRRISKAYAARGQALHAALEGIGGIEADLPDGGLQLTIRFTAGQPEAPVLAAMTAAGFRPARLSGCAIKGGIQGLVVGFGTAGPADIARFAAVLRQGLAPL